MVARPGGHEGRKDLTMTENYRAAWKRAREEGKMGAYERIRAEWYGYTKALRDAGAITEQQRKTLFIYGTV